MDKKRFDLQLFAEEGASAATDEAAATAEPTEEGAEAVGQDQQPAQEQKASFNDLLKDEQYKREYDKRVEGAVRRRMRAADAKLAQMDPMFDVLAKKYGVGRSSDGKLDMQALQAIRHIESRREFANEDWLFIITTDHGGHDMTHFDQSPEDKLTFIVSNKKEYFLK